MEAGKLQRLPQAVKVPPFSSFQSPHRDQEGVAAMENELGGWLLFLAGFLAVPASQRMA